MPDWVQTTLPILTPFFITVRWDSPIFMIIPIFQGRKGATESLANLVKATQLVTNWDSTASPACSHRVVHSMWHVALWMLTLTAVCCPLCFHASLLYLLVLWHDIATWPIIWQLYCALTVGFFSCYPVLNYFLAHSSLHSLTLIILNPSTAFYSPGQTHIL